MATILVRSQNFSPKSTLETLDLGKDLQDLVGNLVIASAVVVVVVEAGTDDNPQGMRVGAPVIAGTVVTQRITGGLAGNVYCLSFQVTTADGQTFEELGYLPVQASPAPPLVIPG